jgi:hypothetical protein
MALVNRADRDAGQVRAAELHRHLPRLDPGQEQQVPTRYRRRFAFRTSITSAQRSPSGPLVPCSLSISA